MFLCKILTGLNVKSLSLVIIFLIYSFSIFSLDFYFYPDTGDGFSSKRRSTINKLRPIIEY